MWSMGLLFAMFLLFHDISILVQHKAASTCHENFYFVSNIFLLYIPFAISQLSLLGNGRGPSFEQT